MRLAHPTCTIPAVTTFTTGFVRAARRTGVLAALFAAIWVTPPAAAQQAKAPPDCKAAEHRQMDFWIGEWEVTWEGGKGSNRISADLAGCAIEENFNGGPDSGGLVGRSFSIYDRNTKRWRQLWVDNQGGAFDLTGGPDGTGRFILETVQLEPDQPRRRMVFENITADGLDWRWQGWTDGAWQELWHLRYRRAAK